MSAHVTGRGWTEVRSRHCAFRIAISAAAASCAGIHEASCVNISPVSSDAI
jgi:hypothetical protein